MINPLIQTKALSKRFIGNQVLNDIDISVDRGKSLLIIGGSGQGKSVLLKCIVGLIKPDTGSIFYKGSLLEGKHKQTFMNSFGIVFQGAALFDSLPVWENISFKYKHSGLHSSEERRQLAAQKIELVGLPKSSLDLYPSDLSGGMQKRVGIARAISTNPKIIFFDEPTSGLDPIMSNTINKLIRGIIKELGSTTITISHDLNTVRAIADSVALLNQGKIEWNGTLNSFEKSKNKNVRKFIAPETT